MKRVVVERADLGLLERFGDDDSLDWEGWDGDKGDGLPRYFVLS